MRHAPYKTGKLEGMQWLYCMEKALEICISDKSTRDEFLLALRPVVEMLA
jgi:truncated hemoglobin YjbI